MLGAVTKAPQRDLSRWTTQFAAELASRGAAVARLPAPEEAAEVLLSVAVVQDDALVAAVGPVWSADHVRQELGIRTRQALHARRRAGSILGVPTMPGAVFYPVSQFQRVADGVRVRPGLQAMWRILKEHDPWAVATLVTVPAPELEDLTPLAWERDRRPIAALEGLARRVAREWQ